MILLPFNLSCSHSRVQRNISRNVPPYENLNASNEEAKGRCKYPKPKPQAVPRSDVWSKKKMLSFRKSHRGEADERDMNTHKHRSLTHLTAKFTTSKNCSHECPQNPSMREGISSVIDHLYKSSSSYKRIYPHRWKPRPRPITCKEPPSQPPYSPSRPPTHTSSALPPNLTTPTDPASRNTPLSLRFSPAD